MMQFWRWHVTMYDVVYLFTQHICALVATSEAMASGKVVSHF